MKLKKPKTIEEAKEYACTYTSRHLTPQEVEQRIEEGKAALQQAITEESKSFWTQQVSGLTELINCQDFQTGNYHQGTDEILLEMIEWRAMFYAFQEVETSTQPFNKHPFFQQWKVGGAYTMYSLLFKLVSGNTRNTDSSLRKLWWTLSPFIEEDIGNDETAYMSSQLDENSRRFSNQGSKAIAFRNKVIAHNEKSIAADLDHLDKDIQLLTRIWSFIITWSSFGLMFPWRDKEQAFSGLEHFYNHNDLINLKRKRQEYLDKVELWCKTNLVTSEVEQRSPFGSLSLTVSSLTTNK